MVRSYSISLAPSIYPFTGIIYCELQRRYLYGGIKLMESCIVDGVDTRGNDKAGARVEDFDDKSSHSSAWQAQGFWRDRDLLYGASGNWLDADKLQNGSVLGNTFFFHLASLLSKARTLRGMGKPCTPSPSQRQQPADHRLACNTAAQSSG